MSKHKISSSPQEVPFSWENLPGISKITPQMEDNQKPVSLYRATKLRPPPNCSQHVDLKSMAHGLYIPLPPCRFQPNPTPNRKGVTRPEEDPFLAAFIECTKPVKEDAGIPVKVEKKAVKRNNTWSRFEGLRLGLGFSCKSSCSVREGNLVKLSKLPEQDHQVEFEW
ncbi:hypothetical protein FCM35_KLT01459 [Carex littledalei]|uniref:Uncharacterized protein n=1 Tax=Carex littledalei TaxID=544730 RepID=A0A833R5R3_9POAL|nr:hypothetical protein FCM35_KLT01459 [Carex littledalei]